MRVYDYKLVVTMSLSVKQGAVNTRHIETLFYNRYISNNKTVLLYFK